jgi:outer membrane protein assembly factor BamD
MLNWAVTFYTLCILSVLFLSQAGCASSKPKHVFAAPQSAAEKSYQEAVRLLDQELYQEAQNAFSDIKSKHPYSNFAILADLGIADSFFERKKYIEASEAYNTFITYQPNHTEVPYAMLKIGHAHFEQIPTDFWFLPPAAEKDQTHTQQALQAYASLVKSYPEHPLAKEARDRIVLCENKLANHERYVGRFYWKRHKYAGAAQRFETLISAYPQSSYIPEALWTAGASRARLGQNTTASSHLQRLVQEFPLTPYAGKAKNLLLTLPKP